MTRLGRLEFALLLALGVALVASAGMILRQYWRLAASSGSRPQTCNLCASFGRLSANASFRRLLPKPRARLHRALIKPHSPTTM